MFRAVPPLRRFFPLLHPLCPSRYANDVNKITSYLDERKGPPLSFWGSDVGPWGVWGEGEEDSNGNESSMAFQNTLWRVSPEVCIVQYFSMVSRTNEPKTLRCIPHDHDP